jgi:hypothetical protein
MNSAKVTNNASANINNFAGQINNLDGSILAIYVDVSLEAIIDLSGVFVSCNGNFFDPG